MQKELDEQNEKLEKAKAQYTQLKSSAVGSNIRALSETYYSEIAFNYRSQETEWSIPKGQWKAKEDITTIWRPAKEIDWTNRVWESWTGKWRYVSIPVHDRGLQ